MTDAGSLLLIDDKVLINPRLLTPGMVTQIEYTNRRGEKSNRLYLVMDVNPELSQTLHVLEMDRIQSEQFYKLLEFTNTKKPLLMEVNGHQMHKMEFNKVPRQNYEYNIKPILKSKLGGAYKVLKFKQVHKAFAVEYKWREHLIEKFVD